MNFKHKYVFLFPGLFVLVGILIFPIIFVVRLSLSGWNSYNGLNFIGLENYVRLFTDDPRFWESFIRLSFLSVTTVTLQYVIGFALAHMVWKEIKFQRFFRVLFLIPMMTTPVIMTVIWRTFFHESLGPVNDLLQIFDVAPKWLTDPTLAKITVIIVEVWQWTPFMFLLLLAGLLSLPKEPFLAAAIDGASPIRKFIYVTFPLMAPISIGAIIIRLSFLSVTTVVLQYVIGFTLAHMVWKEIKFQRFFRVLFLIPMMTTPVIMTVIWRTFFHESLGPVNDLLQIFDIAPKWLTDPTLAKVTVIIVEVWQWTPFMFLLLLAGLLSLPKEPFLAAAIDGASPIRKFIYVTFPLMAPISIGAIIIRLIEASKIMDTVYVLTSGGPGTSTETSSFYIFIKGLREFQMGYAASMSFTYLIIMIISLTVIAKVLTKLLLKD